MKEKESSKIKILPITELEKVVLKNKIMASVDEIPKQKRRNRIAYSVVMCSVILLGTCFFMFKTTPEASITKFVNESGNINVNNTGEVVLVLSEGQSVNVTDDSKGINYSKSGETVVLGDTEQLQQNTQKNNKVLYNTLLVPYGRRGKIKLSDGSIVWLNSGSKIVYPAAFNGKRREVYLEGEAIFDVAHNKSKPFIVLSENQEVEVLGTVFCVTSYKDEKFTNTVLKSGSVKISYKENLAATDFTEKMKITPGTKASFNKGTKSIMSEKVNVDNYFSWRDGILIFKNNSLKYITKRVSRYYNVDVDILNNDLANETFSGYLDLNENIESVLQNIAASTDMIYTLNKNKIIINQKQQ
ncbi:FecR domain-containing protein [Tamlana sp. 62-3]|uniref:FecR domain-containing protein n=1 Tax=Neotamlana sargassicola TaxID=2883125 RepID=A0A9X1IA34_9FLAO|nr:FecR domain-containing protein [Tamlana sargassicola]MCB4809139.1 FecR domain-containing protein [Tamlana sargassicola]